jgi:hypothetical protein
MGVGKQRQTRAKMAASRALAFLWNAIETVPPIALANMSSPVKMASGKSQIQHAPMDAIPVTAIQLIAGWANSPTVTAIILSYARMVSGKRLLRHVPMGANQVHANQKNAKRTLLIALVTMSCPARMGTGKSQKRHVLTGAKMASVDRLNARRRMRIIVAATILFHVKTTFGKKPTLLVPTAVVRGNANPLNVRVTRAHAVMAT